MEETQPPTDKWYSYVRRGNFIIQYRDYVLGYMDGRSDIDDGASFTCPARDTNEDFFYSQGYCDGYYKRPIKKDREL